jgi:hypothetical protein
MPLDLVAGWNITSPDPIDTRYIVTQSSDRYGFSFARIHNGLATFESESQEYYILANSASYTNAAGWSRIYTSDPGGQGLNVSGSITASVAISASSYISGGTSFHLLRDGGGGTSGIKLDAGVFGSVAALITPTGDASTIKFGDSTSGYVFDLQNHKISFDSDAANTYIQGDTQNPENLNIHADQDIYLRPDHSVVVFAGPSSPSRAATFGIASSSFHSPVEIIDGMTVHGLLQASESLSVEGAITASSLLYVKDETTDAGGILLYGGTGLTTTPYISPQGVAAYTLRFGKTPSGYNFDFGNNKISFDSDATNTYIQANTENPEDLEIHADQDIILHADGEVIVTQSLIAKDSIEGRFGGSFEIVNFKSLADTTIFGDATRATLFSGTEVRVTPSLTASNDISASGDIYAQNFYVDTLVATHLSSSTLTSSFVSASTLEVRSITASDSSGIFGGITASNIFANEVMATNRGSSIKVISRNGDDLVELAENSSAGGGEKRGKLEIKDHNRSSGVTTAIFLCPNGDNFISSSDDSGFAIGSINPRGKFSVHDDENPTITVQDERTSLSGVVNDPYELGRYRFKSNESSLGGGGNDTLAAFELVSWDFFGSTNSKSTQLRYVDHPRGSGDDYKTLLLSANHGLVIQKDQDYPNGSTSRIRTEERPSLLTLKGFDGAATPALASATSSLFGGGEDSYLSWRALSTSGYENYIDITNKGIEYKNTYDFSVDDLAGDVVDSVYNNQYRVPIFITGSNAYAKGDGNLHNSFRPLFKVETTCGYNYRLANPSEFYHAYISTLQELRATTHDVSWSNYKDQGTNNSGYLNYILFTTKIKGQPGNYGLDVAGAIRLDTDGGSTNDGGTSIVWFDPSDERLKTNIKDTKYGLSDLLKIKVRDFDWWKDKSQPKPSGSQSTGFIAQELHEVYPKAVNLSTGDDPRTDPSMVSPSKLIPLLVQAVQDQQKIIDNLQEEINLLKTKIK